MTKPYRVLVTGSRDWTSFAVQVAMERLLELLAMTDRLPMVVVSGGGRGADALAFEWASQFQPTLATTETHPADWELLGKAAGPLRNQEMVAAGADICLAFPLGESRGTRDCMERARKAGIPVLNFGDPDDRARDA